MRLRVAFMGASLSACAVVSGLSAYTVVDESPAVVDAAVPDTGSGEASPPRPPSPPVPQEDASVDACTAVVVAHPLEVTSARESPCTMRVALDQATAGGSVGTSDTRAELTSTWSEDGLRLFIRTEAGRPPGGSSDDRLFMNDAVELFIGTPAHDGGAYAPDEFQVIIDHRNRSGFYRAGKVIDGGAFGVVSATTQGDAGYVLEVFIPASAMGRAPLAPGAHAFDIQIDSFSDAGTQASYWLYANTDAATPGSNCPSYQAPFCNAATWGVVRLLP